MKTIIQEPVVNPLSARFDRSDLMCERRGDHLVALVLYVIPKFV